MAGIQFVDDLVGIKCSFVVKCSVVYLQLRLRDTEVGVVSGPDGPPLGGCVR